MRTIEDRASASWSDEQLVAAARGGDVEAFAAIYDRYADALFNACYRQLGNRDEAADVVQDTFVLVNERLDQLRDASRLKSWLYAIATRESLRLVRARARSTPTDEFGDIADHDASPEEQAERSDLAVLLRTAAEGLSPTERSVLGLHLSGLSRPEIAEAVGLKVEAVHVCLHRLRGQVELSLGALLILRRGRRDCDGLASAVGRWDGRFSPRIRKRVVRHVRDCEACESRRARLLTPEALLGLIPWFAAPEDVRAGVLDAARQIAALFANDPAAVHQPPPGGPPPAVQVSRVPPDASRPAPPATAPAGVGMVARLSVAATVVALLLGVGAMRIGRAPIEPEQVNPVAERAEPPAEVVTASAPPAGQSSGLRSELAGNGDQTTTGSGERRSTPGERAAAQLLPAGRASLAASAPVDTGNLNLDLSVPAEQAGVGGATLALDTTGKPTTVALASGPGPVTEAGTGAANGPTVIGDAQVPGAGVAQEQAIAANPAANPVLTAPAPNPQPAAPTVNAQPPAPLPVAPTAPAPNGNNTVTLQRQPAPSPGPQANVTPDEEEQQVEVLAQPPAPPADANVNTNVNPNPNVEQPSPLPLPVPVDEAEQQVRAQPKAPITGQKFDGGDVPGPKVKSVPVESEAPAATPAATPSAADLANQAGIGVNVADPSQCEDSHCRAEDVETPVPLAGNMPKLFMPIRPADQPPPSEATPVPDGERGLATPMIDYIDTLNEASGGDATASPDSAEETADPDEAPVSDKVVEIFVGREAGGVDEGVGADLPTTVPLPNGVKPQGPR